MWIRDYEINFIVKSQCLLKSIEEQYHSEIFTGSIAQIRICETAL